MSVDGGCSRDLDMWVDGGESCCRDQVKQLLEDVGELIDIGVLVLESREFSHI
jgi:hypothetical protein